jgi:hypothetical protein
VTEAAPHRAAFLSTRFFLFEAEPFLREIVLGRRVRLRRPPGGFFLRFNAGLDRSMAALKQAVLNLKVNRKKLDREASPTVKT